MVRVVLRREYTAQAGGGIVVALPETRDMAGTALARAC